MPPFAWPQGRKAAVSLTYDDALTSHHRAVAPFLQEHGFHGTFYLPVCGRFLEESEAWRETARAGHELGNHTLFHPCFAAPGQERAWLDPSYNLRLYSPRRWQDEVRVSNWALRQVDGRPHRSFGNTCHDRWIGEGPARVCLDTLLLEHFIAARGEPRPGGIDPAAPDFANLGTQHGDVRTFAVLREELTAIRAAGRWIIYTFHGVGPEESSLCIDAGEHRQLIEWLAAEGDFWVAPVAEVAAWLKR